MTTKLQFKFDANQEVQIEAVDSIVRLFDGLPNRATEFRLGDEIVPNLPSFEMLSETWLHNNLSAVQEMYLREPDRTTLFSATLAVDEGPVISGAGNETWRYPHFTVEMETGTGKTYVYLRTIYELRKRFGFGMFVVVVPSIAFYEGVI